MDSQNGQGMFIMEAECVLLHSYCLNAHIQTLLMLQQEGIHIKLELSNHIT
jgi:hypothetical protein